MPLVLRPVIRAGLLAVLLSALAGCATPGDVRISEFGDVSGYSSWDWLLSNRGRVDAQTRGDVGLEYKVAREVESALEERGFRRDSRSPNVLVYFYIGIQRQLVREFRTGAMNVLSSLHESPSYWVQASETEYRYYEVAELRIVLVDAAEKRVIWRGVHDGRYPEEFAPHIRDAVTKLVGHLPRPRRLGPRRVVDAAPPRGADDPPPS